MADPNGTTPLCAADLKAEALRCGFALAGLAPAQALPPETLHGWLASGQHADMEWMARNVADRLDPRRVLPNARTVLALAIPYHRPGGEKSMVARYARGRDYHNVHRHRMRKLRRALLQLAPGLRTYACVDTGVAMEKEWAERAGLGFIGKNGCLIHPQLGSWLTLSVMFFDRAVDRYDDPVPRACGDCQLCLRACPTDAFTQPGVVDARLCIAYQSIENRGVVPEPLGRGFRGRVFGCDVCQEVCPFNRSDSARAQTGDPGFGTRSLALLPPEALLKLTREECRTLSEGSPLARAGHEGLRRNAVLALGANRAAESRPLLLQLTDDPNPAVARAAQWALSRLKQLLYRDGKCASTK